jgi:tetratricopeptide (TPR) repeat protein
LTRRALEELEPDGDTHRLLVLAAHFQQREGNPAAALELVQRAVALAPLDEATLVAQADLLTASGRGDEALAGLEAAVAAAPARASLSFALVQKRLELKQPDQALKVLETLSPHLRTPTERARLLYLSGEAQLALGRPLKAVDVFQSAARLVPGEPGHHYALARALESLHRSTEAARSVREGMLRDTPGGQARARAWLQKLEQVPGSGETGL